MENLPFEMFESIILFLLKRNVSDFKKLYRLRLVSMKWKSLIDKLDLFKSHNRLLRTLSPNYNLPLYRDFLNNDQQITLPKYQFIEKIDRDVHFKFDTDNISKFTLPSEDCRIVSYYPLLIETESKSNVLYLISVADMLENKMSLSPLFVKKFHSIWTWYGLRNVIVEETWGYFLFNYLEKQILESFVKPQCFEIVFCKKKPYLYYNSALETKPGTFSKKRSSLYCFSFNDKSVHLLQKKLDYPNFVVFNMNMLRVFVFKSEINFIHISNPFLLYKGKIIQLEEPVTLKSNYLQIGNDDIFYYDHINNQAIFKNIKTNTKDIIHVYSK